MKKTCKAFFALAVITIALISCSRAPEKGDQRPHEQGGYHCTGSDFVRTAQDPAHAHTQEIRGNTDIFEILLFCTF